MSIKPSGACGRLDPAAAAESGLAGTGALCWGVEPLRERAIAVLFSDAREWVRKWLSQNSQTWRMWAWLFTQNLADTLKTRALFLRAGAAPTACCPGRRHRLGGCLAGALWAWGWCGIPDGPGFARDLVRQRLHNLPFPNWELLFSCLPGRLLR